MENLRAKITASITLVSIVISTLLLSNGRVAFAAAPNAAAGATLTGSVITLTAGTTAAINAITVTDSTAFEITAANDIRIKIPSTVLATWDTTDTTANAMGGTAAAKVSTTVSYADSGKTLVLDVTANFTDGQTVIVSGLSYVPLSASAAAALTWSIDAGAAYGTGNANTNITVIPEPQLTASIALGGNAVVAVPGNTTLTLTPPRALANTDNIVWTMPEHFSVPQGALGVTDGMPGAGVITCSGVALTRVITCTTSGAKTGDVAGTITIAGILSIWSTGGPTNISDLTINDFAAGSGADIAMDATVSVQDPSYGGLTSTNVQPASLVVGVTSTHTISFTMNASIPVLGKIAITYPDGFDVTGANGLTATSLAGLNGVWTATLSGQMVVLTQTGGTSSAPGAKSLNLAGINNPTTLGSAGTYYIFTIMPNGLNVIEVDSIVAADTIIHGANSGSGGNSPSNYQLQQLLLEQQLEREKLEYLRLHPTSAPQLQPPTSPQASKPELPPAPPGQPAPPPPSPEATVEQKPTQPALPASPSVHKPSAPPAPPADHKSAAPQLPPSHDPAALKPAASRPPPAPAPAPVPAPEPAASPAHKYTAPAARKPVTPQPPPRNPLTAIGSPQPIVSPDAKTTFSASLNKRKDFKVWQEKYHLEKKVENGIVDTDLDGFSDIEEFRYGTNPQKSDSDGDGITDIDEILTFKTNPLNPADPADRQKPGQRVTNFLPGQGVSDLMPLIKGIGPINSKVTIIINNLQGQFVLSGTAQTDQHGVFVWTPPHPLTDNRTYKLIVRSYESAKLSPAMQIAHAADNVKFDSKPLLIKINTGLNIAAPNLKKLADATLNDDVLLKGLSVEIKDNKPVLTGKAGFNHEVIATWSSIVMTSALIADNNAGDFQILPGKALPIGHHEVYVQSIRPKDKAISKMMKVSFDITPANAAENLTMSPAAQLQTSEQTTEQSSGQTPEPAAQDARKQAAKESLTTRVFGEPVQLFVQQNLVYTIAGGAIALIFLMAIFRTMRKKKPQDQGPTTTPPTPASATVKPPLAVITTTPEATQSTAVEPPTRENPPHN